MKSKFIAVLALGLSAITSQASEKIVCSAYNMKTGKILQHTLVFEPQSDAELKDGSKNLPYKFSMYKGAKPTPIVTQDGHMSQEDVVINFKAKDGTYKFQNFLDEHGQGLLIRYGQSASHICW